MDKLETARVIIQYFAEGAFLPQSRNELEKLDTYIAEKWRQWQNYVGPEAFDEWLPQQWLRDDKTEE